MVPEGEALRVVHVHLGIKGGAERFFVSLVNALAERGCAVVAVPAREGRVDPRILMELLWQLNTEHGFSLHTVSAPDMARFEIDLAAVERSHMQYLGVGAMFQLSRPEFAEKLVRALHARVRSIFETALGAVGTGVVTDVVSPPPDVVGSVPPAQDPRASSGAW